MEQIVAIVKQSKNCEQFIKYECYGSGLWFSTPYAWWVSRCKDQRWITGVERQLTVGNVHVEWPTAVQVEENVIVTGMTWHGVKTVDIWLTRTHCLLLSWDLEIPVALVLVRKDITHWENCDVGVRIEERILRDIYINWNVII
jgi:hypothetical protein